MSKTILLGGLYHETHTFLAHKTGLAEFEDGGIHIGQAVLDRNRGNGSPSAGFIAYAENAGWRILPTIQMAAQPAGKVTDEVVALFLKHFLAGLDRHMAQLDGIFLVLHGAMVSESADDVEGLVIKTIRDRLKAAGRGSLPIGAVLDLHGNISKTMVENATVLRAYRENPHTDAYEASVAAAGLLDQAMAEPGIRTLHRATDYVISPVGVGSANEPMLSVLAAARAIEAGDPDILAVNVMAGYAYSDIADCGFSFNIVTRGARNAAERHLDALVEVLRTHVRAGYPREDDLATALARADALPPGNGPILLIEPADNIGGGTPGDATGLLGPLLATGRGTILAAIADREAVAACFAAGAGHPITLEIGGKTDSHHGTPIAFTGTIERLSHGAFELENPRSHMASMGGTSIQMGRCAVLVNEQAKILLSERKTAPMDLGQFHSQGLRPEEATYVVIKAAVSHRSAYEPIQRASFYVDSPGLCTSDLRRLPFSKLGNKTISLD
jgi:microcystin degradation protein MlrC